MKRRTQKIATWIIVGLLAVSLLGGTFYGAWQNIMQGGTSSQDQTYKSEIASLKSQVEQDSTNLDIQTSLGNTYYDYGIYLSQAEKPDAAAEQFALAVGAYEKVVTEKEDINVYVDMATAAFYANMPDEAIAGFENALKINPTHFDALHNYAVFLAFYQADYDAAIQKMEEAKKAAPSDEAAQEAQEKITSFKEMQKQKALDNALEDFQSGSKP